VIQIRASERRRVLERLAGVPAQVVGSLNARTRLHLVRNAKPFVRRATGRVGGAWSEVSFRMQQLRDEPGCAQEEFDRILDREDPDCRRR